MAVEEGVLRLLQRPHGIDAEPCPIKSGVDKEGRIVARQCDVYWNGFGAVAHEIAILSAWTVICFGLVSLLARNRAS